LAAHWRQDSTRANDRDVNLLVGGGGFEPP
jgi:hypothetical protein